MSRPVGSSRRSGDPRLRAAASTEAASGPGRGRVLAVALVIAVGLVVGALWALPEAADPPAAQPPPDGPGQREAFTACELTSQAGQAADGSTRARYAAAVFLLDQAVIATERAALADPGFASLDEAVQAVHTAGHRGDPEQWRTTLDDALSACAEVAG